MIVSREGVIRWLDRVYYQIMRYPSDEEGPYNFLDEEKRARLQDKGIEALDEAMTALRNGEDVDATLHKLCKHHLAGHQWYALIAARLRNEENVVAAKELVKREGYGWLVENGEIVWFGPDDGA